MEIFAKRLRERAAQLGVSNSEAARRIGLEERRFGHYVTGDREPDLATLKKIAQALGTTPNWLLGVENLFENNSEKTTLVARFKNSASIMSTGQLEICVIQAEALAMNKYDQKN